MNTNKKKPQLPSLAQGFRPYFSGFFYKNPASPVWCWKPKTGLPLKPYSVQALWKRAAEMFERWGSQMHCSPDPWHKSLITETEKAGSSKFVKTRGTGAVCTQQMLVNNFLKTFVEEMGGDIFFEVAHVSIQNQKIETVKVTCDEAAETRKITCNHIVGCDGSPEPAASPFESALECAAILPAVSLKLYNTFTCF